VTAPLIRGLKPNRCFYDFVLFVFMETISDRPAHQGIETQLTAKEQRMYVAHKLSVTAPLIRGLKLASEDANLIGVRASISDRPAHQGIET